ncbi:MAG: nucleotidyl transferase AbiEii/AbiGii toxin family protein [Clostridiales bacterium]|nr:nucleotidyl transferase AbiEii/AbiGii toxin family protein [Clostridiales bacterium]
MFLHKYKEKFVQLVEEVSEAFAIEEALVEKDYFVSLFLRELVKTEPLLIFKGGTCLSKCFKLIKRFSEDIDINLDGINELPQKRKKKLKDNMLAVIDSLGLALSNSDQIKSGMDYNLYKVEYPALFVNPSLKQHLEVESVFRIEAFPTTKMPTSSLIYDYLKQRKLDDIISQFGLGPFNVRVQALERTFADKIFAICDYYLSGRIETQSRHIYDLYKILPHMTLDNKLKSFVEEVRKVREGKHDCLSANKEISLSETIIKIIEEKTYENDYNALTAVLLYEPVTYDQAIKAIKSIADWLE